MHECISYPENGQYSSWVSIVLFWGSQFILVRCLFITFSLQFSPIILFFVKQSGVFLFLIGLFYFSPLVDFERHRTLILLIVFSKLTAVIFLLINDHLTPKPSMILLAAAIDALMAAAISLLIFLCYKTVFPLFISN